MERIDKINYYLDIAETILERGTCLRRNFGAIIVKNDEIISTGYVGAPRGRKNCCDQKYCLREKLNIPRGERYELCRSVHAEQNAIISASRRDMIDSTLYLVGKNYNDGEYIANARPCALCKRMIINATLNGIPNFAICLIKVMNVSDAKIIVVKINTPIINNDITCFRIYLSKIFVLLYFSLIFSINVLSIIRF